MYQLSVSKIYCSTKNIFPNNLIIFQREFIPPITFPFFITIKKIRIIKKKKQRLREYHRLMIHLPEDGEPVCSTASLLRYGRYSQWSADPHLKAQG